MPRRKPILTEPIKCAECAADVSKRHIELNENLQVVCIACYLKHPPQDDIDAAIASVGIATDAVSSLGHRLRPRKLSKREYAEARRFTDIAMGRVPAPRKKAQRG